MKQSRPHGYEIWVFVSYAFYIVTGLVWLVLNLLRTQHINLIAVLLIAAFGIQWYYRNRLANLVIGVICLFFSILMLLQAINLAVSSARLGQLTLLSQMLVLLPIVSLLLSGVLIFSYLKLNFRD